MSHRHACQAVPPFWVWLLLFPLMLYLIPGWSADIPEYRLKAVFLYNFANFTDWPSVEGNNFNLCIFGKDPFGNHLDQFLGKQIDDRSINLVQVNRLDKLHDCQVVFIANSSKDKLRSILDTVNGNPVLTVADMPDAAQKGVILNMVMHNNKVSFEVNLNKARDSGLHLNSKLLRLATDIIQ